jgi:hypothetical protein
MKQIQFITAITFLLISLSCQKVYDIRLKRSCRIEKIVTEDSLNVYFSYDQWNNPISVRSEETGTGYPDFRFTYDEQHQLTVFEGFFSHYYTYDESGLAIVDTINDQYTGASRWYEEKLFYDEQRRVGKSILKLYLVEIDPGSPIEDPELGIEHVTEYNYDDHSNLIRYYDVYDDFGNITKKPVTYDQKTNANRTNNVWMLMARDYSLNNPNQDQYYFRGPNSYNEWALPLDNIDIAGLYAINVYYDCAELKPPDD